MQILLCCLFLLTTSLASARDLTDIQKSGTMKVAVDGETPGFNYFKGKELVGFEIDLVNEIAKGLKVKVEWVVKPFNTLLVSLNQDRFDLVGTSHTITPEREKVADFGKPYYCTGPVIISRKDGPKTVEELRGKTVAVAVGTVYFDFLNKQKAIGKVKSLPGENDGLRDLLAGHSDAWVTEQFAGEEALKVHAHLSMGKPLFPQKNAMVVAKGNRALLTAVDAQLEKLLSNGVYAKISQKHLGKDIRCH